MLLLCGIIPLQASSKRKSSAGNDASVGALDVSQSPPTDVVEVAPPLVAGGQQHQSIFSKQQKAASPQQGCSRRLQAVTTINDKGEEVTETVWVDGPPSVEKAAPPAKAAAKTAPPAAKTSGAGGSKGTAKVRCLSLAQSHSDHLRCDPQGKAAGQKGIMSFFGKKE